MARFYAFVKEQESITFPEKPLDPGGRPATEKEEGVRYKQMHMKSAFDDGSQRINPEAEICITTDDIDAGKVMGIRIALMNLQRNSSETDESISIEIPFICICTLELFERIERFARMERISGAAVSNEEPESERTGSERGTISGRV